MHTATALFMGDDRGSSLREYTVPEDVIRMMMSIHDEHRPRSGMNPMEDFSGGSVVEAAVDDYSQSLTSYKSLVRAVRVENIVSLTYAGPTVWTDP